MKAGEKILVKQAPLQLKNTLKAFIFLRKKQGLISKAQDNEAPQDIINVLNRFEDKKYGSAVDVAKEVAVVE